MAEATAANATTAEARGSAEDTMVIRIPTLNRLLRQVLPEETVHHLYAAQREQLLALRSLVDTAIHRLEEMERDETPRKKQRIEIAVE